MSLRTKAIGALFIVVTVVLALLADLLSWSIWAVTIPAVILEILFFVSVNADASHPD